MTNRKMWIRGDPQPGPRETIGVLELRPDGFSRVALAERNEVDGRCHVLLARRVWGGKDSLETRWWSLVLDVHQRVTTIRNGSASDPIRASDVPRIARALEDLDLHSDDTMVVVDDGLSAFPWRRKP